MPNQDGSGPVGSTPRYGGGFGPCGCGMRRGQSGSWGRDLRARGTRQDYQQHLMEEEKELLAELDKVRKERQDFQK